MTCDGCAFSTHEDSSPTNQVKRVHWYCWREPGERQVRHIIYNDRDAPPACADRWEGK